MNTDTHESAFPDRYDMPSIRPDGTPKADLVLGSQLAMVKLDASLAALRATAPQGRDYDPSSPTSFKGASMEYHGHVTALIQARDYVGKLHSHLTKRYS